MSQVNPAEYIAWVQRSLNRILTTDLPTNGQDTSAYRAAVREFKAKFLEKSSNDDAVDERTQNALIRQNEMTDYYICWVQTQLLVVGHANLAPPSGTKDSKTVAAIKGFQQSQKINTDGIMGFFTEAALVRITRQPPPGDIKV